MMQAVEAHGTAPGKMYGVYLAQVTSVQDDQHQGRVQVKLLAFDGVSAQSAPMWARVAVPFAGANRGAFLIPSKDDVVIVQFVHGEPSAPIVVGGIWNGQQQAPEQLGGAGEEVDRWTLVGKQGTRIAIVEEQAGAKISLTTPNASEAVHIVQQAGGKVEVKTSSSTVTLDSQGVTIRASNKVQVIAPQVQVNAPSVTVNAALSQFNGIVKAIAVQTPTVIGNLYTPGSGNVW